MVDSKILHLVLKHHWYDSIENGSKTHEYREYKYYWIKRLYPLEQWGSVKFQRGYSKNPPKMLFKLKSIKLLDSGIETDLHLPNKVFDIELGERINE